MKPNCLPDRCGLIWSSKMAFITFSSILPKTGRRLTGLYDFGIPASLSSPFRIGTTIAAFHVPGNTALCRQALVKLRSLSDNAGQSTRTILPVIPSAPGALFGEIPQAYRFRVSSVTGGTSQLVFLLTDLCCVGSLGINEFSKRTTDSSISR